MDAEIRLSNHAFANIHARFHPRSTELAWAVDALGRAVQDGLSRFGREVWRTHDATIVLARHRGYVEFITVLPASWPVEIVGREYVWREPSSLPASPGALRRLAERFGRS